WQIEKGQKIARLVMCAGLLELRSPLCIDQRRRDIRKRIRGIASGGMALGLDKDRPARFQATQGVVETAGNSNELGRHGTIEVRSPKFRGTLKRTLLVEDDPLVEKSRPRQKVGETSIGAAVFGEIHHGRAHVLR